MYWIVFTVNFSDKMITANSLYTTYPELFYLFSDITHTNNATIIPTSKNKTNI